MTSRREPQALFAGESLEQTLRQLMAYDVDGLPVVSADGSHVQGWVTDAGIIGAVARRIHGSHDAAVQAARAAGRTQPDPGAAARKPPTPLPGYHVAEIIIQPETPAVGAALGTLTWPPGCIPVSVRRHNRPRDPDPGLTLSAGDRIVLLTRQPGAHRPQNAPVETTLAAQPVPLPSRDWRAS